MNAKNPELMGSARRRLLVQALVGFGLWQISNLILYAAPGLAHPARVVLRLLGVAGAGIWVVQTFKNTSFLKALKRDPALAQTLNDERYQQARTRAFAAGYFALLVTAGLLLLWSLAFPLPGRIAAQRFLIVAVCSAMIALLMYDRE